MRKLYAICFAILIPLVTYAQNPEKYRGTMPTRISRGGEVTYYYIPGANNKKMKHGRFKYSLRHTAGVSKIYQDIYGNYNLGLKDGQWSFRTRFKDYKQDRSEEYLTGTMILKAKYRQGNPDGPWHLRFTYKTRKIESINGGRTKWKSYNPSQEVVISMKFNNLKMVDSVYMQSDDGRYAEGICNENGFFEGSWNFEINDLFIRELYDQGFLYKKEIYNKKDTVLMKTHDYSEIAMSRRNRVQTFLQKGSNEINQLTYTLDTISVFKQVHPISHIVHKWIFDNPYLLFNELDGDTFKEQDLTGGYMVQLVNQVTPDQRDKIAQLENLVEAFKQMNIRIENLIRGKSISNRTRSTIQLMGYYERMAEKYACLAESLTSKPDFVDGKKASLSSCNNTVKLTDPLPEFHSRNAALDYFLNDLTRKSETMQAYEKMLKNKLAYK